MTPEDWKRLMDLKSQTKCEKDFACIRSEIKRLCQAKYHLDFDILECLENLMNPCAYAKPFSATRFCTCPLRKFIAQNLENWTYW